MSDFKNYRLDYKMDAYAYLTCAIITKTAGHWTVSTSQYVTTFDETEELDKFITENLDAMEELVKDGQIEREMWDEAWSFANSEAYARDCVDDMCGRHDPLDKPATEISPWDVYSLSELL